MSKVKKLFGIAFVIAMLMVTLTGCGAEPTVTPSGDNVGTTPVPTFEATPITTPEATPTQTPDPCTTINGELDSGCSYNFVWYDNEDMTGILCVEEVTSLSDSDLEEIKNSLGLEGDGPVIGKNIYKFAVTYTNDGKITASGDLAEFGMQGDGGSLATAYFNKIKENLESRGDIGSKYQLKMLFDGEFLSGDELKEYTDNEIPSVEITFTLDGNSINVESCTQISGKRKAVSSIVDNAIRVYERYKEDEGGNYVRIERTEYREDGTIEKTQKSYSDGGYFVQMYDENGNETYYATYFASGHLEYERTCDENGNVIYLVSYNSDGKLLEEVKNGICLYRADYREGVLRQEEKYDENGNEIYFAEYYENGQLNYERMLDENGNRVNSVYFENGELESETKYDENGKIIYEKHYNEDGDLVFETYYDENGDPIL